MHMPQPSQVNIPCGNDARWQLTIPLPILHLCEKLPSFTKFAFMRNPHVYIH